ncbi:MAG: PQQ-binding-like beta-propeller repeat protein [Planctomycetota bacterium]|nr:PQQ-binding-like beta-propeller repeat protein [Planctomycetota bacterium]
MEFADQVRVLHTHTADAFTLDATTLSQRAIDMKLCQLIFGCAILASSASISAADFWNQFRGPTTDGHAPSDKLPLKWSETNNVAWKTPIAGKAWSSPVVWGNQAWVTNATDGKDLYAVCVNATTGKIEHTVKVFHIPKPMFCIGYNSYASPTPVVEAGMVWVHFGSAGTACLDTASGKILWARQDLPCDHLRGPGSSPIVFRDLLIINFDGADHQYVVALNKLTGKTVWKTNRTIDYKTTNGDAKKAYCTPTVFEHDDRLQLVSPAAVATIAYNPLTGDELWKVYHGGFNAAARPLYTHGKVIINLEGGLRLLAVKPDGTGDVTKTHIAWTCKKSTPTRPSQLVIGDHLFMVNDKGVASCVDIETGEPVWTHRMEGRHSASPIYSGGRIYFCDEDGVNRVIAADTKEFRLLAENKLDTGSMASPGVVDDALLIRTKTHLYRIEQR